MLTAVCLAWQFEGVERIARRMRIFLPTTRFRVIWDWALIFLVIYSVITVPIEVSFDYYEPMIMVVLNVFVDVFFIIDIMINFRTAYYNHDGTFELDPHKIRNRYVLSWFFPDLLASIPFDLFTGGEASRGTTSLALAKMPRMLRLFRLLKKLDMFTSARAMRVCTQPTALARLLHSPCTSATLGFQCKWK